MKPTTTESLQNLAAVTPIARTKAGDYFMPWHPSNIERKVPREGRFEPIRKKMKGPHVGIFDEMIRRLTDMRNVSGAAVSDEAIVTLAHVEMRAQARRATRPSDCAGGALSAGFPPGPHAQPPALSAAPEGTQAKAPDAR